MKRYQVEADDCAFWVIDTTVEDGEPCNVSGAWSRENAQRIADRMNDEAERRELIREKHEWDNRMGDD